MVECPACRAETLHEVLSGRIGGKRQAVLESTVRCRECGQVHHAVLKSERPVEVPVIISWIDKSARSTVALGPDEAVRVGDEMMCGDVPLLVTSIEVNGVRVKQSKARDIQTLWAKRFEKVRVPFSVGHAGKTYSEHVLASPDEEFCVGDILDVGKREVVIHTIKTARATLRSGGAEARDIVRAYAHIVRKSSY